MSVRRRLVLALLATAYLCVAATPCPPAESTELAPRRSGAVRAGSVTSGPAAPAAGAPFLMPACPCGCGEHAAAAPAHAAGLALRAASPLLAAPPRVHAPTPPSFAPGEAPPVAVDHVPRPA